MILSEFKELALNNVLFVELSANDHLIWKKHYQLILEADSGNRYEFNYDEFPENPNIFLYQDSTKIVQLPYTTVEELLDPYKLIAVDDDGKKIYEIGANSLNWCCNLTSINCPLTKTIDNSAFSNCHSLLSVDFPQLSSICTGAFSNNTSLIYVCVPRLETCNSKAFYGCVNLTLINMSAVLSVPSICSDSFEDTADEISCYIPTSLHNEFNNVWNSLYPNKFAFIDC